jgi:DNA repair ATPase RecN
MVNQNVQEALKKFQDNKTKEYEKTQKQINEIIGSLNKHQTETESTINREINELRTNIDNIKEVTHDMENLRKKKQKYKTKWKAIPAKQNKQKTESQNLKMKWQLKEKLKNY